MKIHRMIHKILLSIGIALGIVTVGATSNAKADQVNANNTADNTPRTNQNIGNNRVQSRHNTLINQSSYNSRFIPKYSIYHSNFVNNYKNLQNLQNNTQYNKTYFRHQLNHVYKDMLLYNERQFSSYDHKYNHFHHHKVSPVHSIHTHNNLVKNYNHTMRMASYSNKNHQVMRVHHHHHDWFRDGLSRRNLSARNWISWHESSHRWNVLSYGGVCVGYFQLNPHYLGYRHGHVDLRPKHQVKVADHYVRGRYGNWANAKRFWVMHHWY